MLTAKQARERTLLSLRKDCKKILGGIEMNIGRKADIGEGRLRTLVNRDKSTAIHTYLHLLGYKVGMSEEWDKNKTKLDISW